MSPIWNLIAKIQATDLVQNLLRDLKSLRVLWNYIYMALFVWMDVWTMLYHPAAIPTALTVTGGVVSVIFTGYVLTTTYEKAKRIGQYTARVPAAPPPETTGGGTGDADSD